VAKRGVNNIVSMKKKRFKKVLGKTKIERRSALFGLILFILVNGLIVLS
jgi:hypothetical protein